MYPICCWHCCRGGEPIHFFLGSRHPGFLRSHAIAGVLSAPGVAVDFDSHLPRLSLQDGNASCTAATPLRLTLCVRATFCISAVYVHERLAAPQDEIYVNGATVLPHKELKESVPEPRIIL